MATMHAPGTGLGGGDLGSRSRRAAVIAASLLAFVAIVVPFTVRVLHDRDAAGSGSHQTLPQATTPPQSHPGDGTGTSDTGRTDSALGVRGDLPSLLPAASPTVTEGQPVRVGDITTGTLHRASTGDWQVLVRWDGRLQPLPTRGPVALGAATWVSRVGLLYTRVPTGTPGRFHVYAWNPVGGTAYTPPTLVAISLGDACFNPAFTAFGSCS